MLAMEDAGEENSAFIQLALSNTIVLRAVFKFLPASTLKSCSLVNKLWRTECYAHCRENVTWLAKIPVESPCSSLREFNELVSSMTLVPYNGLTLHVDQTKRNYSCLCNSPEDLFTDVLDKLTWRHLDILIDFQETFDFGGDFNKRKPVPCAAVRLGMTVLKQKIVGLESLKFRLYDDLQCNFDSNWPPAMPNLKVICFPQKYGRGYVLRSTAPKSFFTRLTNAAPSLKEINGWTDYETLKCFAEEKWGYVKDFIDCNHPRVDDELIIAPKFVSQRPSLRKLILPCAPKDDHIIHNLLKMSQTTLEHLEISGREEAYRSIQMIDLDISLPKLRLFRLDMVSGFGYAIDKAQSLLNQHGPNGYPQLEEFQLSVDTVFGRYGGFLPGPDVRDRSDRHEQLRRLPDQPCTSVSTLRLESNPALSSFVQLHRLFPAVTDLRIICQYCLKPSRFPYKQIFRLWQNLTSIVVCYNGSEPAYILDAAFCGLNEEEVDLLEKEDDAFLMAVQLVPIAPCVLTMRNMVSFNVVSIRLVENPKQGITMTRVARLLARRYLPKTELCVL